MQLTPPDWNFDDEFDGGEESCGRVIINLLFYMKPLTPLNHLIPLEKSDFVTYSFP